MKKKTVDKNDLIMYNRKKKMLKETADKKDVKIVDKK